MSITRSPTQYKGVRAIAPPDITLATRAPASTDTAFLKGQLWLDTANEASYQYSGTTWIALGSGTTGALVSLTGDSGGAIVPVGGNIDLLGTAADGISFAGTTETLTASISAASTTQRGTLETSTDAESVTGTSDTVAVTPASLTARLAAPGTIGDTTPAAGTFTSVTATTGDITATDGDLVLTAEGNKMIRSSVGTTTAAGANSIGTVTLVEGTATISTTSVTASSIIRVWREGIGSTGAAATGNLTVGTRTTGDSFVINAINPADATALATTDVSVVGWEIIN